MKKIITIILILVLCISMVGSGIYFYITNKDNIKANGIWSIITNKTGKTSKSEKLIDDWQYSSKDVYDGMKNYSSISIAESAVSDSTIGLSVGGAKNINNFRENIENGYFPISTDITYNGIYSDYYFNTGKKVESTEMFSPAYSTAISKDPISGKNEYYMTVGLNSNIKQSDFKRKKLNIVIALDISGSMSSNFNSYYYDGNSEEISKSIKNKMEIANESVNLLLDELKEDDRVGIVLFDDEAYLAKEVNLVKKTDMEKIKEHVLEIKPQGGTNFEEGYKLGTQLFTEEMLTNSEYENRIIVITDAMPNMGKTSKNLLVNNIEHNADKGIYTSFIGVGVDFNTSVVETLSNVKGSNYYSVHNSEEFKKIMSENFDYMVTPLVFDLNFTLESDFFEIENIYGTDSGDKTTGSIMSINTLFPSSTNSSGESKGGIILLKLKEKNNNNYDNSNCNIKLKVSYTDREGNNKTNEQNVQFEKGLSEYYSNTGIRKGIVLARYVNLMKNWILYERNELNKEYLITDETGIKECCVTVLGENERKSVKLTVSDEYKNLFGKFYEYMKSEVEYLGDNDMKQELQILNIIMR
ncbi:MAG: VWA domain-containing protein [Clostridiales bacterium]|nr:VWA domain-containing protein [Clostridiales bacterium]